MATIYTYSVIVDGYSLATDSKETVAYLCKNAKSTMSVWQWCDFTAKYEKVSQFEFAKWDV